MRPQDIGILTPYAAQCDQITLLVARDARLHGVAVRDVDGFQGNERDFVVVSFVRCNHRGDPGFVDNSNRLNVILTRARRGLAVLGNEATLRNCKTSGLVRFLQFVRDQGVAYVYRDGRFDVAGAGAYAAPPLPGAVDSGAHSEVARNAKRPRDAVPSLWSLEVALRHSPGVDAVVRSMQQEGLALSRSVLFLVALARMISLPAHGNTMVIASEMSPLEWDRKAWSREHFFAQVGMALDPGNAVLAAALWALMAVAKAVHDPACY